MSKSLPSLAETFARQLLKEESDLTGSEEVFTAARIPVDDLDEIAAMKRANSWDAPIFSRSFRLCRYFQSTLYIYCLCITRMKSYLINAMISRCFDGARRSVDVFIG